MQVSIDGLDLQCTAASVSQESTEHICCKVTISEIEYRNELESNIKYINVTKHRNSTS